MGRDQQEQLGLDDEVESWIETRRAGVDYGAELGRNTH
jgi:hypothetical protein